MLLPDDEDPHTYYAVLGEKESGLWFFDRSNPGKCLTSQGGTCSSDTNISCSNGLPSQDCTANPTNAKVYWTNLPNNTACNLGANNQSQENWLIHNTPAYWESTTSNYLYIAPTGTKRTPQPLFQYTLCTNGGTVCATTNTSATFPFGTTPSISASAPETATDGIVWANANGNGDFALQNPLPTVPGVLYAFDADNVATQLYASSTCPNRDRIAPATKFSVPTVANGYVYVGAEQCTWNGSQCTNNGTGTFYIFTTLSSTIPCS